MRICSLLGSPGVGKGTFAKLICSELHWKHISLGYDMIVSFIRDVIIHEYLCCSLFLLYSDILRAKNHEMSHAEDDHIKATMLAGNLVSDSLANDLILNEMSGKQSANTYRGYLLDGYPRTLSQARFLHQYITGGFSDCDSADNIVHKFVAIHIKLDQRVAVAKLLGRRICQTCGGNFNVASVMDGGYDMPAILPDPHTCRLHGRCDPILIMRSDDTEHTINKRIDLYMKQNQSILDFYSEMNTLQSFEVTKGVKDAGKLIRLVEQSY